MLFQSLVVTRWWEIGEAARKFLIKCVCWVSSRVANDFRRSLFFLDMTVSEVWLHVISQSIKPQREDWDGERREEASSWWLFWYHDTISLAEIWIKSFNCSAHHTKGNSSYEYHQYLIQSSLSYNTLDILVTNLPIHIKFDLPTTKDVHCQIFVLLVFGSLLLLLLLLLLLYCYTCVTSIHSDNWYYSHDYEQ